jgi:hypothetical protein
MRLKLFLIGFFLLMMSNLAGAMYQGCNPENFTEKETHDIDIRYAMDLFMHRDLNCNDSALSFKVAFSGEKIPGTIIMTCGERSKTCGYLKDWVEISAQSQYAVQHLIKSDVRKN